MARDRATRLREFEQLERQASPRHVTERKRKPLGINTMEAPEELMERRRMHRQHVAMAVGSNAARNALLENVILLIALIASIYGLYRLALYLLNQV